MTVEGLDAKMLVRLAASLERGSEHPIATAVVAGARERKIALLKPESFEAIAGEGARGIVSGQDVALGNRRMIERLGLQLGPIDTEAAAMADAGKTILFCRGERQARRFHRGRRYAEAEVLLRRWRRCARAASRW